MHLVGFSGGAGLIYDIVATPGFPHAIDSVATVAGAFGLYHADRPDEGFTVTQLQEGTPVSALLVQGGLDDHLPAAGGLDHTGRESHVSFRSKVDYWRLATGTETAPAEAIDVAALDPQAPADLEALRYSPAGHDRGRGARPRPASRLARLGRHGGRCGAIRARLIRSIELGIRDWRRIPLLLTRTWTCWNAYGKRLESDHTKLPG